MTRPENLFFPASYSCAQECSLTLFTLATAHLGYAQTCTPGQAGVTVDGFIPATNVQSIVNSNVCGSTFVFAPGVLFRNLTIFPINETTNPIDGRHIQRAVLEDPRPMRRPLYGGTVVSNFTQQGSYWVGPRNHDPRRPASGANYKCDSKHPGWPAAGRLVLRWQNLSSGNISGSRRRRQLVPGLQHWQCLPN